MTKEEAITLAESKFWEGMTAQEIAKFQLLESRLCMPFEVFHKSVEEALNRPVWTYEFGLDREGLIEELFGAKPRPIMEDIINLIPEEKRIILITKEDA
mgnify:CR=1 FL=1